METLTLDALADGAGRLELAPDGTPRRALVVVDLSVPCSDSAVEAAAEALRGERTPVLVGVAPGEVPARVAPVIPSLTCILDTGSGQHRAADLDAIAATVARAPVAAVTLAGLLPLTARSSVADGLIAESLAYSTLLAGSEFRAWRTRTDPAPPPPGDDDPVLLTRSGDELTVTLNRPSRHNAFARDLRDGLVEALEVARLDRRVTVRLRGNGPSFCSGGDLSEFGSAEDVSVAHLVRVRSNAGAAVHAVRDRVRVTLHGACIGAGIEVPSFAGHVSARKGTWFRLPELGMGLIPGAGGTVSITHRVGRWRTAFMCLSGRPVDLTTALAWGLVDAQE
jgi:hypothetical protein